MSFITFDYKCPKCGAEYPNVMVRRSEMDEQRCSKCKATLQKLPAGPITTFKFGDRSAIKSKKAVSLRDPH
jgi:predicted nucleic acid-binding Zn ribbon protein